MRKNYFEKKQGKAEEFIKKIYPCPDYRKINFNIRQSALIVTDMQEYFLNKNSHAYIPASESIVEDISSLVSVFRKNNRPVIFTRHINTKENAGMLSAWWSDIITEENYSGLTEKLDTHGAKIIIKTQYDAFYKTELEDYLKSQQVKSVVITGVATHLCCETTARAAFVRGFEVFFPVDCTATYDEEFHLSASRNLSHGFAHVTRCPDLLKQAGKNG